MCMVSYFLYFGLSLGVDIPFFNDIFYPANFAYLSVLGIHVSMIIYPIIKSIRLERKRKKRRRNSVTSSVLSHYPAALANQNDGQSPSLSVPQMNINFDKPIAKYSAFLYCLLKPSIFEGFRICAIEEFSVRNVCINF